MTDEAQSIAEQYMREMSIMLSGILGGGSEWFKKVGDAYYVCPEIAGAELQRRKTDAINTKKALFRARSKEAQAKTIEALQADKVKLREALRRISIGDGIGGPDAELQCADIARAALQETER